MNEQMLKFGKKEATYDKRDILFKETVARTLKIAPVGFGHGKNISWGMLGNDDYGDCVEAGADHETMLFNAINGIQVRFETKNTLSDYSSIAGFDPNDPSTDQGTNMRDAMNYRRSTGMIDANGNRHKIAAYVAIEPGNFQEHLEALYYFDAVAIGFMVPRSAMDQFYANKPWTYVRSNTGIIGGHYVVIEGRPLAETLDVVTWGKLQRMSKRFLYEFNDESYAVLSEEAFSASGKSAEGYDYNSLLQMLGRV